MKLQTTIPLEKQQHNLIDYNSKIVLLGSCFSENIGNTLSYFKFKTSQNPFGILFHPLAIEKLITNAINEKKYSEKDIFNHNEIWHSFEAHSSLSAIQKETLLNRLNLQALELSKNLKQASHIVITLGTAWVYRHIESDEVVANCHKVPQKKFLKELLTVDEIYTSLQASIELIKSINKKATIILTVSPVRHLKDGFIENSRSKSHLISGIHKLVDKRKNIHYFPSYELMMDELRDYRFYEDDMIHPNTTAIKYIWEKFTKSWFTEHCFNTMKKVDAIQKGLAHKPFNEESEAHQQFKNELNLKIELLKNTYPFMEF